MIKKNSYWLIFLFLASLIFSSPFIFKGKIPIPADTILGMYHPWRDKVWEGLTSGVPFKNFLITDPVRQQYIWKKLAIEAFKKGSLPLWNPYTHSGMPLLANFQTGAFYFFNFLFLIFDFNFAWALYILLQPLLASLFLFLYLRELKLSNFTSVFGGMVFAFSGFMTAWLEWGNLGHTVLWLPLILLAIEKIVKKSLKKSLLLKWGAVFVFSLTASFFAGHLQSFFYLFLFTIFYILWRIMQKKPKEIKKIFLFFVCCLLLFISISAIQWLPTWQLIKLSARNIDQASLVSQDGWFLPFEHLVQFIAPDFFGNPATMNYWGKWNYGEFIGYVGIIPLVFSIFAIFKGVKKRKENKLLNYYIVVLLISLLLALPTPLAKLPFLLKIPLISTAQPTRLLFIVDFCLAVLSALGLNKFLKNQEKTKNNLIAASGVLLAAVFVLWVIAFSKNLGVSLRNLILPTGILFLFFIATILFVFWKKRKSSFPQFLIFNSYLKILIFLVFFDLLRFSWKFNPFVKKEWIFPKTKVIEFLENDQSLWRMMTLDRRIFPPNFSAIYKIQTIEGYDPLFLKDYGCLITKVESGEETQECDSFNRIIRPVNFESEIIDELNVKYVLSLNEVFHPKLKKVFQEGETIIYENLKVKPRIELANGEIRNVDYQENQIKIEIKNDKEGDLVLRDSYYPGWQTELDGKTIEVSKTEHGFRKVLIPAGEHEVRFFFSMSFL